MKRQTIPILGGTAALLLSGFLLSKAQDTVENRETEGGQAVVEHPDCTLFVQRGKGGDANAESASDITVQVTRFLGSTSKVKSAKSFEQVDKLATIDKYLLADMQLAGVTPADKTSDFEFIRRVTLDLTGRIPVAERVLSFAADTAPDKRARLIDELLAKPEWVDKWTMYFGDLYANTDRNTFVQRFEPGRNAFYQWIKDSLTANKPYNQMVTELISSGGSNSWVKGELNWLVGGFVINNPVQDNVDQQAANVAETFLGISHMNCILCHNGRGHLDELSLWGKTMTRSQAWGFASYLSRTNTTRAPRITPDVNAYYWIVDDSRPQDYQLNTTTGNRPSRAPIGTLRTMAPAYPFNGAKPATGENYRVALAREVTADIQFARATVNYMWKQFFGRGIVDPVNQFDPARLDPDNPPAEPWTLQPSNARLLNTLAQEFVADGFSLKTLMRKITNSEAYQVSSRYNGDWKPDYEKLFARKLVRRLWGEEIHDAVVQSSGIPANNGNGYNLPNFSSFAANSPYTGYKTYGPFQWAMQSPDVNRTPDNNGAVTQFLNAFMRGNRDEEERRSDGSVLQALNLMNDTFINSRINGTTAPLTSLLRRNQTLPAEQIVDNLYLAVLSRYPSADEKARAVLTFRSNTVAGASENLLWSLYNKVDFTFNY